MRKMLKKLGIVIPSAVLTLLMAVGFSTPAFAYVEPEVKEEPAQVIEEEEPTEEEKIPFTIAGNGEVEDNITDDSSKEFFTVKTKGGNTFFLVIDRARNSENVYMLSMIAEYDLQEFLTDEERNGKEEEKPAVVLPETKPEPEPDVEIEEPELADEIRKKMFVFEDILMLDDRSIQRVLREVENSELAVALKNANEEVQNVIFNNMSTRLVDMIKEDMEYMGPVRLKDVEEAQQKIVNIIRKLEDSAEIVISRGGGDEIIV